MKTLTIHNVVIAWNTSGEVIATPHGKTLRAFEYADGACHAAWDRMCPNGKWAALVMIAWRITTFYNIPAEKVEAALKTIPEWLDEHGNQERLEWEEYKIFGGIK